MDPVLVVVHKGLCQNDLGTLEACKTVRQHILLLERHVERLHVSVLFWHVPPDELVSYSRRLHGFLELAAVVLWDVVSPEPQVWDLSCRRSSAVTPLDSSRGLLVGPQRVAVERLHRITTCAPYHHNFTEPLNEIVIMISY